MNCSKCGKTLEAIGQFGGIFSPSASILGLGNPSDFDMWRAQVCTKCRLVFCGDCLKLGLPTPCLNCGNPTEPAFKGAINAMGAVITMEELNFVPCKICRAKMKSENLTSHEIKCERLHPGLRERREDETNRKAEKQRRSEEAEELRKSQKEIIVEAPTLDEAKKKARELVPDDAKFINIKVLEDGKLQSVETEASSWDVAVAKAKLYIPEGGKLEKEILIQEGKVDILTVLAFSDVEAKIIAQKDIDTGLEILDVACIQKAKNGFLGFGRISGKYNASFQIPWKVSLCYRLTPSVIIYFQPNKKDT